MSLLKRKTARVLLAAGTSWYLWNFRRKVISALADIGKDVVVVAPDDEYAERLASLPGVRWFDWPLTLDGARPDQEISSLLRYIRIIRETDPGFVINHGIKANIYGGLACRLLSIPYSNSVTGLGTMLVKDGPAARAMGKLYAFACNRAEPLFIQNYDDLAALHRMGLSENVPTVRTMGSGVDLDHFALMPMPRGSARTFVFVGRLQRDKGIVEFVDAARSVRYEHPETRFIAIGSRTFANRGALSDHLLEEWKRENIVEFVGHEDDVRPWLAKAHVLVLPSRGEGMPRVILEAAATGRPSIATDVPGCRDAVIHRTTGFLVPQGDGPGLIEAMRIICRVSDEELAALGRAARSDAESRFSDTTLIDASIAAVQRSRMLASDPRSETSPL